ncbi:Hypothetical protein A7982_05121 [Minicystis rosea]|nr:Hypothetical protein A7982_05121 [Minicystis rosea]
MDPLLAERRRLGTVEVFTIEAGSLPEAHAALGARLAGPARASIRRRLEVTSAADLPRQIRDARASRAFLEERAGDDTLAREVRRGLHEYLDCLDVWGRAVGAASWLDEPLDVDGQPVSTGDLALWAQDDNVGCQTGMLRQSDGSVLFWHTEEDRLGLTDRPRLATFALGRETLSAYLYPYLLPGPAFGFCKDQIHAIDSLVLQRGLAAEGAFTSVASFLVWRLRGAVPAREMLRSIAPHLDGCAINVVRPSGHRVQGETHEIGGRHVQSRTLGTSPGSFVVQANAVLDLSSPLAEHEGLSIEERCDYDARIGRVTAALEKRLGAAGEPGPADVLRLLGSRDGGRRAFANLTVKGHFVARVTAHGVEIHIGSGSALSGDIYSDYRYHYGEGASERLTKSPAGGLRARVADPRCSGFSGH